MKLRIALKITKWDARKWWENFGVRNALPPTRCKYSAYQVDKARERLYKYVRAFHKKHNPEA